MTPRAPNLRNVRRIEVLSVFDAPAQILLVGIGLERRLEDVQRLAVGAVADGMHTELIAVLR